MVLHDSHAEVLACRALNYFLLAEIIQLLQDCDAGYESHFIQDRSYDDTEQARGCFSLWQPYELRANIEIWMFSSEAPCGDASMEILMSDLPDVEPWANPVCVTNLHGRGYFSNLGVVRRKPARGDAEATMSKSCTDKLTLKQTLSLLSFHSALLIAPTSNAYLSTLVLPHKKHSRTASARAFGHAGRLSGLHAQDLVGAFRYRPFETKSLSPDFSSFAFSKPGPGEDFKKTGNVSALHIHEQIKGHCAVNEALVGGVKQGFKQLTNDNRKASCVSRRKLCELTKAIIIQLAERRNDIPGDVLQALENTAAAETYGSFKASILGRSRGNAKALVTQLLGNWTKNDDEEDWVI